MVISLSLPTSPKEVSTRSTSPRGYPFRRDPLWLLTGAIPIMFSMPDGRKKESFS
jgi:hypothetical protein